jgi:hypothetical protein
MEWEAREVRTAAKPIETPAANDLLARLGLESDGKGSVRLSEAAPRSCQPGELLEARPLV